MKAHASGTPNDLFGFNASHSAEDHHRKSGFPNPGTHPLMVIDLAHVRTFHRPVNTRAVSGRAVKMYLRYTSVDTLTAHIYK